MPSATTRRSGVVPAAVATAMNAKVPATCVWEAAVTVTRPVLPFVKGDADHVVTPSRWMSENVTSVGPSMWCVPTVSGTVSDSNWVDPGSSADMVAMLVDGMIELVVAPVAAASHATPSTVAVMRPRLRSTNDDVGWMFGLGLVGESPLHAAAKATRAATAKIGRIDDSALAFMAAEATRAGFGAEWAKAAANATTKAK